MLIGEGGPTMFYGTHFIMSPPFPPRASWAAGPAAVPACWYPRTLSYKYRDLDAPYSGLGAAMTLPSCPQLSAPGVLKVFGDSVCSGTHYKASWPLARPAHPGELVREALERYALGPVRLPVRALRHVVGQAAAAGQWQAQGFRVFGDNGRSL